MPGNLHSASPASGAFVGDPVSRKFHQPAANGWVADGRFGFLTLAMAWTLIVLMIVPDNFDYAGLSQGLAPAAGGLVSRVLWLGLLLFGLGVVLMRSALAGLLLRYLNPFLLLFALLALVSILWSIEPGVTARRCIRVATVILDAVALTLLGWHPQRFQSVVRPIITAMLFGSLLFGLISPTLAIHQETSAELAGAWRGLANHKNTLGALACMGLIFWMHAWLSGEARRWRCWLGALIALTCLLLSRSSTSFITAVFALCFLALTQRAPRGLRPYLPYIVGLFAGVLLIYALAVLRLLPGSDMLLWPITALTGKDPSFTGRAEIWRILTEHIGTQPVLGGGLGAYWTGIDNPDSPSFAYIREMSFYPGSAHNGYLEILNDLGTVGLLCLGAYIVRYLRQALQLARLHATAASLYLALFLQQAIANLSESHWLNVLSLSFVIMTLATAGIARLLLDLELRRVMQQRSPAVPAAEAEVRLHA